MKRNMGWTMLAASLLCLAAGPAAAYRPFDGTDAGVADEGEFELELGPAGYLREGSVRSVIGPAVVANFGISGEREIVIEGKLKTLRDKGPDDHRTSLEDTALSLKQLHRAGSLQGGSGLSVASECGILLPTYHGESGMGATCAGIVSQRWQAAAVHLNGALVLDRKHEWHRVLGVIVEGPDAWPVRPVLEIFGDRDNGGGHTNSALLGLIWRARDNLAFDVGVRAARADGQHVSEVRAGLTWGFGK